MRARPLRFTPDGLVQVLTTVPRTGPCVDHRRAPRTRGGAARSSLPSRVRLTLPARSRSLTGARGPAPSTVHCPRRLSTCASPVVADASTVDWNLMAVEPCKVERDGAVEPGYPQPSSTPPSSTARCWPMPAWRTAFPTRRAGSDRGDTQVAGARWRTRRLRRASAGSVPCGRTRRGRSGVARAVGLDAAPDADAALARKESQRAGSRVGRIAISDFRQRMVCRASLAETDRSAMDAADKRAVAKSVTPGRAALTVETAA